MSLLKKNIAANFTGNIWQSLMGLAFIPLYIKFMGVESYGLIGVCVTLQTMFALLDMGMTATVTRELARLSVLPGSKQEMRNLVRSLEVIYWCIAVFIGMAVVAIAPLIAHHWINANELSSQTIERAVRIMGFVMALQWPISFYSGGLVGLQRQVLLNAINIGMSTLRGAGAVLILWLISPTIQAFFSWQIIIGFLNTFVLALFLWRMLPRAAYRATFQMELLAGLWRFAAGISAIAILGTILTQIDKIVLSKMLSLKMFGYYTLAWVVAMSLYRIINPVYSAVYPKFTQLVSIADDDGLKKIYHKSCQLVSVLILPVTAVVALFSYEILLLWTQSSVTAEKSHLLVSILIIGTALNGLMYIPYALQLAHGWTRLTLYYALISVIIVVPLIILMTNYYGVAGAASVWLIPNSIYVLVFINLMHKRLLPHEKWRWYWQDVILPLFASLSIAVLGRLLMAGNMSRLSMLLYLIIISILTLSITALTTSTTRTWLLNRALNHNIAREVALT